MHAAATRRLVGTGAPPHRQLLAANGIEDPDAWLADARDQVLAALHEHGPMTARSLGTQGAGAHAQDRDGARQEVVRVGLRAHPGAAEPRLRGRDRAHEAHRHLDQRRLHVRRDGLLARRRARRPHGAGGGPRPRAALAARLRPGTTTDLQWWMGWTVATTKHALADAGAVAVLVDGGPAWVAPGDEEPADAAGPVGRAAARARPDDDGLEGARLVPPRRLRRHLRPDGQRRPDDLGRRAGRGRLGAGGRRGDPDALPRRRAGPTGGRRSRSGRPTSPGCWGRPGSRCASRATCRPRCSRATRTRPRVTA